VNVRWAREKGWLQVWDPFDRTWLEVFSRDCPASWRDQATARRREQWARPKEPKAAFVPAPLPPRRTPIRRQT